MSTSVTGNGRPGRWATPILAGSLLATEFVAGMQRYLSQTVLPLVAAELHGSHLYGPLDAAAQAPMFLTMPIGAWLLSRFRIGSLMIALTAITVAGAVVSATSTSMEQFIAGTALRALAAGALATVGMGAISRGLPPRYRQLVLAGMSGMWVFSSVLGPVYAAAAASLLSWRWAMVLYLPVLLLARAMIARSMPERAEAVATERAPWGWALVLAAGSVLLSLPLQAWSALAIVIGAGLMLVAAAAVLPEGTLRARTGRRAWLAALLVVAAVYFGATGVLLVVAHDAFGLDAAQFAVVIAAPGLMWAVAGLWTGTHPAGAGPLFARRMVAAGFSLTLGVLVLLGTVLWAADSRTALAGLVIGGGLLGVGMGTMYPDLLGACLTEPAAPDGISPDRMATAVVLAESVGMAVATTFGYGLLGSGLGFVDHPLQRAQLLYMLLVPVVALMLTRLVAAGWRARHLDLGRSGVSTSRR